MFIVWVSIAEKVFQVTVQRSGHDQTKCYSTDLEKNNNSIYCKSVTVDDFHGISISPVISEVFKHCILYRFVDFFLTL